MKTLYKRCAALDVHKKEVVACLRRVVRNKVSREVRRWPTTTAELLALAQWLEAAQCTHVAMEATGIYWKPVWHILEGRFQLILANAAHIKGVPGRKSDVNDATWIADLLAHGLIRASFVPPPPVQELRDLTRTRKQLGREVVQHSQRIQAVLEEANVKLSSAITDILGASGRRILKAMIAGETDPVRLSALGDRRCAASRAELTAALHGRLREHHRFLIDQHLKTIEQLEASIAAFDARIEAAFEPFREIVERVMEVPGLSETSVEIVIAEIGTDMRQFPTAGHLLSWAGLVPRLEESAGKRRSTVESFVRDQPAASNFATERRHPVTYGIANSLVNASSDTLRRNCIQLPRSENGPIPSSFRNSRERPLVSGPHTPSLPISIP